MLLWAIVFAAIFGGSSFWGTVCAGMGAGLVIVVMVVGIIRVDMVSMIGAGTPVHGAHKDSTCSFGTPQQYGCPLVRRVAKRGASLVRPHQSRNSSQRVIVLPPIDPTDCAKNQR